MTQDERWNNYGSWFRVQGSGLMIMTQDERWNNCGSWFFDERSDKVDDKVNDE